MGGLIGRPCLMASVRREPFWLWAFGVGSEGGESGSERKTTLS